ncbi:hypothetical protein EJB05_12776, partial [Eragrostis curvula]
MTHTIRPHSQVPTQDRTPSPPSPSALYPPRHACSPSTGAAAPYFALRRRSHASSSSTRAAASPTSLEQPLLHFAMTSCLLIPPSCRTPRPHLAGGAAPPPHPDLAPARRRPKPLRIPHRISISGEGPRVRVCPPLGGRGRFNSPWRSPRPPLPTASAHWLDSGDAWAEVGSKQAVVADPAATKLMEPDLRWERTDPTVPHLPIFIPRLIAKIEEEVPTHFLGYRSSSTQ